MREWPHGAERLVKSDRESSEDGVGVGIPVASECFVHVLETALKSDSMARQKRKLRGTMGKAFERCQAVDRGNLTDRVHLFMDVERRKPRGSLVKVGDAITELLADLIERACH